jgi:hypothetical protein
MTELVGQLINLFAAILLMLSFAMISQRRILSLIHLFTAQGMTLVAATVLVGYATHQPHLYVSAGITLALKVILIPLLLYRVINRLDVRWDVETLINIPMTMVIGIALVIFAFNLALPISKLSVSVARGTLGIALACVLLSFMMMITRSKAVPAGDRLPVDGKRPVLCRHLGDLRHADGRRTRYCPRRAGRHPDSRRVHVPYPGGVRQPRHQPTSKSSRRTELETLLFVLGIPAARQRGSRPDRAARQRAREVNVAFSLGTFVATCMLTVEVISDVARCSLGRASSTSIP